MHRRALFSAIFSAAFFSLRRNARHQISCGHCIRKSNNSNRLPHPIYTHTRARSTSNFEEKRHDDELSTPPLLSLPLHTYTQSIILPSSGLFGQADGLLFLSYLLLLLLLRGGASPLFFPLSGAEFFSFVLWSGQLFGSILCCFFSFRVYWGERGGERPSTDGTERSPSRVSSKQQCGCARSGYICLRRISRRTGGKGELELYTEASSALLARSVGVGYPHHHSATDQQGGRQLAWSSVPSTVVGHPSFSVPFASHHIPASLVSGEPRDASSKSTTCVEQHGGKALPELLETQAVPASAETVVVVVVAGETGYYLVG